MTETWLSAQSNEAKTVELAPSGFDVKSFPRQSRSRVGGIATVCKSTLRSNITFKANFDLCVICGLFDIEHIGLVVRMSASGY